MLWKQPFGFLAFELLARSVANIEINREGETEPNNLAFALRIKGEGYGLLAFCSPRPLSNLPQLWCLRSLSACLDLGALVESSRACRFCVLVVRVVTSALL